jgi:metal-dependent amidase/aminoacylase/carboxypeptidase family protein
MAAEMAVEIMAQETALTEDSQAKVEHSVQTVLEDHSERAEIVLEDHLETTRREEVLAETVQEDLSERTLREEVLEATVQEDRLERTQSALEDSSVRVATVQEEVLERTQREEALVETEDHLLVAEAVSTQQRRASTRRISTTSVTKSRAVSTR